MTRRRPTDARAVWRRHPWLSAALALAAVAMVVFALRLGAAFVHWSDPANHDAAIEGWMPVGYVARSWDVPREVLAEALGIAPGSSPRQSLEAIARARGESVEALIARLAAAIAAHREAGG